MGESVAVIAVVLMAVLVGAALPVLYQAVQTLKSARVFLDTTGPRIQEAMRELTEVAARLNGIAGTLEEEGRRLKPIVDSAAGIGRTLSGLGDSVRSAGSVIGALSPAFVAGLRAFFTRDDAPGRAPTVDEPAETGDAGTPAQSGPDGTVAHGH